MDQGAGVYVTINKTDGNGRKVENITRPRAVFEEQDTPNKPPATYPLEPHIEVESSPGKFHRYWLADGLTLDEWQAIQAGIAERYEGDPSAADGVNRVMRLPGFLHQKNPAAPHLVRITHESGGQPYTAEQIRAAFPPAAGSSTDTGKGEKPKNGFDHSPVLQELDRRGHFISANPGGGWDILCPWHTAHTTGTDGTVYYEPHTGGYAGHGFKCLHGHCTGRTAADLLNWLGMAKKTTGEWQQPKPITATLHPVPAFDPDTLLPDALRGWVMDEADRMPCPPDYIATAGLVGLGSVIGARCAIKPKARDSWLIVPNLWGGGVGLPSAKKSPAISAGLKPLDRLIALAMQEHRQALDDYEAQKLMHEAQTEAMQAEIKKTAKAEAAKGKKANFGSNGSALSGHVADFQAHKAAEPEAPTLRRYKSNDSTIEKLGELLRANPAGLLVLRDELVGLIASWDREGREGERAFYLEAWNGTESFDTDRIGRGSIFIPNLCVSLFGGIQPDKLVAYLEQATHALANDGMLQRFQLLVYPDYRTWEWVDRTPNRTVRDRAFDVFEKLSTLDPVTWGAAPADDFAKFPYFRFDEAALEIYIEWSANLHRERLQAEDNPIIAQHLAKYDKLFPALALILHLVDCVDTGYTGPVTAEAALRAGAWCEYLEAHARRCFGLLVDDGLRAAQALADKVKDGKLVDGFTARDVRRNQWRHLTTDEQVRAALDWLEDEHWLRSEESGGTGPGRPTYRYFINPKTEKSGGRCG